MLSVTWHPSTAVSFMGASSRPISRNCGVRILVPSHVSHFRTDLRPDTLLCISFKRNSSQSCSRNNFLNEVELEDVRKGLRKGGKGCKHKLMRVFLRFSRWQHNFSCPTNRMH